MIAQISQIAQSDYPVIFSFVAAFATFIGVCAAWIAKTAIDKDRETLKGAQDKLIASSAWAGGYCKYETDLNSWMNELNIDHRSGVGGIIRIGWSSWMCGRAATTSEIHAYIARREKNKISPKFSAGIAALLLIIGIAGTLMSVHPILSDFKFRVSAASGEVLDSEDPPLVNVAESTEKVNALMNNLARAFYPSLCALIGTILVVTFRGIYSHSFHKYLRELDDFVTGRLITAYRPRSISDEYADVRDIFSTLSKSISDRDTKFEWAVVQLTDLVQSLGPTMYGLNEGVTKMKNAADAVASKSNSVATTLTRTLGKKSPLYAAVNGFEEIFASTNQLITNLSENLGTIRNDHKQDRDMMLRALDEISNLTTKISGNHENERKLLSSKVSDLQKSLINLPVNMLAGAKNAFDDGILLMRNELTTALQTQEKQTDESSVRMRGELQATFSLLTKSLTETAISIEQSVKAIPLVAEKIENSLNQKTSTEVITGKAISTLASEAKAAILNTYLDAKRMLDQSSQLKNSANLRADSASTQSTDASRIVPSSNEISPYAPPPDVSELNPSDTSRKFLGGFFGGRNS